MPLPKSIQREIEVAFSKHAQPVWFRIIKYIVLIAFIYFYWDSQWFWIILVIVSALSLCLHFWFRYKTKGWTQSYGMWNYEKNKPDPRNK